VLLSGRKLRLRDGNFSFEEDQVQSFTVKTRNTLLFERGNQSSKPKWLMKAPSQTPASDASVSYLMNFSEGRAIALFKSQLLNPGIRFGSAPSDY